ncbi:MAG: primosomal protein N', partial [Rhodospirillaceae bacterium]|nr:primosomal protein N' [Rhodospirillaceae bacterium]
MPSRHTSSSRPERKKAVSGPLRVRVILTLPLERAYDYLAPTDIPLTPGAIVQVPFGRREALGCVWEIDPDDDEGVEAARLKPVLALLPTPPLSETLRRFIDWVAAYTCTAPGAVLKMTLSVPDALMPPKPLTLYRLAQNKNVAEIRITAARRKVLDFLKQNDEALQAAELGRRAGVGAGIVRDLAKAGLLKEELAAPPLPFKSADLSKPGPVLSLDQETAAKALAEKTRKGGYSVTLLDGVTGSGKTEVYFEAVAAALKKGRQVLVLVPEIALTAQWLERYEARFSAPPAQWHSDLSAGTRRATWRGVAENQIKVVVGARSALFLPFPALGLIIVDEEHESGYKQEEGVIYHARDMAVVRGREEDTAVVLVSATPSLETVANVEADRYAKLHLPNRHGGASLPDIQVIDMRKDGPQSGQWLSPLLRTELADTFAANKQAMLFLNRRGYAPLTLCRKCGYRFQCPDCTAWLVEHRRGGGDREGRLTCHHCGYAIPAPKACPQCENADHLAACGPGVERLAEEVRALFPDIRTEIMSSDLLSGPQAVADLIHRVENHEIDLLIGTQIVAKGHHFPRLTLVGVVDADLGLDGGDLRAAERTYQLLHQVSGRAGRGQDPGRVWLQTYRPDHPVMQALISGGRDAFIEAESE